MWTKELVGKVILMSFAALLCFGCAGNSLRYKVDEAVLADIPVSEKQEVLTAESAELAAVADKQKAEADLLSLDRDIWKAAADLEQAQLGVKKVWEDLRIAERRKEVVLISLLQQQMQAARLAERAAETRLQCFRERREVGQAVIAASDAAVQLSRAHREQAKARLALRFGRRPTPDFQLSRFDAQVEQAQQRVAARQQEVAQKQGYANLLQHQYDQRLAEYTDRRSAVPSYTPSYTPPGYAQPARPPGQDVGYLPSSR